MAIFVDHNRVENVNSAILDPRHLNAIASKRNKFEVEVVGKIIGYHTSSNKATIRERSQS
jgi:hypothetical protein